MNDALWPAYNSPGDLGRIEAVPLVERALPGTTYDVLRRAGQAWPDRVAISVMPDVTRWREVRSRTFGQLLADVHAVANVLHRRGVRRHHTVALLSPNCDELITATLAAELAGVAVPINAALSFELVRELLVRSGARVLITASADLDVATWALTERLAASGAVDTVLVLRPTGSESVASPLIFGVEVAVLHDEATAQDCDTFIGTPPKADDIAALFHTGGTTGAPKLAAHTHANEVIDAWMIAADDSLAPDAALFAALPLFHVNALVVTLLAPLLRGRHAVWAGPLGYRDLALYAVFWRIVEYFGLAAMSAVPTVYAVLATVPVDADVSSMRCAMVGASALPPGVRRGFESSTGIPLLEGYGLTEATCASARSFLDHTRPGSVGQRLPYQEVRTVRVEDDGTWTSLPPGEVGVLLVRGPTVFPGYVVGRDADGFILTGNGKLRDGWLETGDLASIDAEGFVRLVGREKDLIIRGGHNIDPAVIEDALLGHPDVTGASAVGRPDLHSGEVPVAYVTLTAAARADANSLLAWAVDHVTEPAAAPKAVIVVDALPVTPVGKPYKPALRAEATRYAVAAALKDVTGVRSVVSQVERGAVVTTVTIDSSQVEESVAQALGGYAVTWQVALDSAVEDSS